MPLRRASQQIVIAIGTIGATFLALVLIMLPTLRHGWHLASMISAVGLGCIGLWFWLRRIVTLSLEALGRAAEQHQVGNRSVRFPEEGGAELARIGRLLNSVVAELIQSNAELARSEARYRVIFENSRDALTAVGPPDWRFISVNRAAVKLFGVADEATLLTMTPGDVSPETQPDGRRSGDAARSYVETTLRDGLADFDWVHRHVDGRLIPCKVQLVRLELDGQRLVQGTVRDMTEVRAAEERAEALKVQVQEAQKLEAIGRLAGGVAHDFNNMLSVIALQADLALSLLEAGGQPREQLEQIGQVTERTAGLVQQLLAFSRRQVAAPRPLNLDAAVGTSLNLVRPGLDSGMELVWRPGAPEWQVRLDPVQVDQILTNLCSNARDACNGQGRIVISTEQVHLEEGDREGFDGLRPGPHVVLRVEDDGPGLGAESLAHVFEPFYTTKGVGRGTGLGLASVYGIVRQALGGARAESPAGRGACFTLCFPRYEGTGEATVKVPAIAPAGQAARRGRILLVEDQPELLKIFTVSLQRAGYTVCAVADPAAALAAGAASDAHFDLLLSDVVMPGMNGLSLAQELRGTHPGMQELFMSGYSMDVIEERGFDTGGLRILTKPFHMSDLLEAVQSTLRAA